MNYRLTLLALVLALTGASLACGGSHEEPPSAAASLPAVDGSVTAAQKVTWPRVIEAGGVVQARTTALLSARIVGDVRTVLVKPGDRVRAGQVLLRLDDREAASQRTRAVAASEAVTFSRQAAEADRAAATAALTLAESTHKRIAQLHERKAATTQELDEARAAVAGSQARLAAAEARVAETGAALGAAEAAAQTAGVGLSYTTITAPFDGVVTEKLVEAGNQVAPGMPLVRVESPGYRLDVTVDASRVSNLEVGAEVNVAVGEPSVELKGRIAEVARTATMQSQAVLVKIELPGDAPVRSGQFAHARFLVGTMEAVTVPAASIRRNGQLTQVMVAGEKGGTMRLVSVGETRGDTVAILAGLAAGERVVVPGGGR